MRIEVGYKRDIDDGIYSSGTANGTLWYNPASITESLIDPEWTIVDGARIVSASVAMAGFGTTVYHAQVCPYIKSPTNGTPYEKVSLPAEIDNGGLAGHRFVTKDYDVGLSEFAGRKLVVASGIFQPAAGRLLFPSTEPNLYNNPTIQFPNSLTTAAQTSNFPSFFLTIEVPPPEGYADIVVGSDPIYGDERSCVKEFSGDAPKQGDQIRYAVKSKNGADIVVRDDLTYYGNYVGEEQDEIYLSYWNNDQWNDWTVTVNFKQQPDGPTNRSMAKAIKAKAITAKAITARGLNDGKN